jgi:hypothetical protein
MLVDMIGSEGCVGNMTDFRDEDGCRFSVDLVGCGRSGMVADSIMLGEGERIDPGGVGSGIWVVMGG